MKDYCPTCGAPLGTLDASVRLRRWMLGKIAESGAEGITRRDLVNACASRDRDQLRVVIAQALAGGEIDYAVGTRLVSAT